jgi:site-specific recombinase XerD
MINYLNARSKVHVQGALFCHLNHKYLTRYQVVSVLKNALKFLKLNPNDFNTHSFRIGAATSFSVMGKSNDEIKTLGRWKSSAF